jgi:5'-nucleotidase
MLTVITSSEKITSLAGGKFMSERPLILVTNDDGVHAPGIKHLVKALTPSYDVIVVAPASEQSAVSLSISIRHPLRIDKIDWHLPQAAVWSVNGTPADCVKLALNIILQRKPHLIVSGINRGGNAGRNILYSGTVGGVIEGIMQGVSGIAFSASDFVNPIYGVMEGFIPSVIEYALTHPLPSGTFLNVNFPEHFEEGIKGFRFAKQGKGFWSENPEMRTHPTEGNSYYWLGVKLKEFQEEADSDITLLKQGFATAVPIQICDLTHYSHFEQHQELFDSFTNQAQALAVQ